MHLDTLASETVQFELLFFSKIKFVYLSLIVCVTVPVCFSICLSVCPSVSISVCQPPSPPLPPRQVHNTLIHTDVYSCNYRSMLKHTEQSVSKTELSFVFFLLIVVAVFVVLNDDAVAGVKIA